MSLYRTVYIFTDHTINLHKLSCTWFTTNKTVLQWINNLNKFIDMLINTQGDIGWRLPKYRSFVNMLRLWNRFLTLDNTRITKHVFDWEYGLHCSDSWSDNVRSILNLIGLNNHYNNRLMVDLNVATTLLINNMEDEWRINVSLKPKLRSYIIFKNSFGEEEYLTCLRSRAKRSLVSQLRLGIFPLEIEVGRFWGIDLENRICKMCNINIENECHYLFECPCYQDYRETLLNHHGISNTWHVLFIYVFKFNSLSRIYL